MMRRQQQQSMDSQMSKDNTDGDLKKTIMFSHFFFRGPVETVVKSVMISDPPTLATFYFFPKSHAIPDSRFLPLKMLPHSMHQLSILKLRSNNYDLSFLQLHICHGIWKRFVPLKFHVSSFESFPMPFFVNTRKKELVFPLFCFFCPFPVE